VGPDPPVPAVLTPHVPAARPLAGTHRRRRAGRRTASAGSLKQKSRARPRARRGRRHVSRGWLARTALVAMIAICAVGLVGTVTAIGMVDYFAGDLPTIEQLQTSKLTQTSRILDRNGKLIEALCHQNRTVVPMSQISVKLQRATID